MNRVFGNHKAHGLLVLVTGVTLFAILQWLFAYAMPTDVASSMESVRLRNALIGRAATLSELDWTPEAVPAGYLLDTGEVPEAFASISQAIVGPAKAGAADFAKAVLIATRLRTKRGDGTPILSNTRDTYRRIIESGDGYCSDYTQVFNALAKASGIPVREWGLSFDGFGGDGHAFNEIYDRDLRKWVLIDSYWSFYVRDPVTRVPLSGVEFRNYLMQSRDGRIPSREPHAVEVVPIVPERFAFKSAEMLLEYYRRGADQFYLYWGNNVFSYDANSLIRATAKISRAAEQTTAILIGLQPGIRIIADESNRDYLDKLWALRERFVAACVLAFALALALFVEIYVLASRRRGRAAANHVH